MSGGYTSLPTSHLPGSVPAAVVSDSWRLESGEASIHTFQSANGQKQALRYQPLHEINGMKADPSGRLGASGEGNAQPPSGWKGFFSVAYYRPYFNVDTYDVVQRITDSLCPHRGDFLQKIAHNPDMYGPLWIATTLVFMATVFGNYSSYLSFEPSSTDTKWVYDINYVSLAAAIFYAYICFVPLGFYFLLQYLGVPSSLVQIWCLYGYSLFIFIPASFLLLIPLQVLKWIIIVLVGFVSAFFAALNIQSHIRINTDKNWSIPVLICFILQLCLAFVVKLCFFV